MVEFAFALIPILLLVILIICNVRGAVRWAGFFILLIHTLDPLGLASLLIYAPSSLPVEQEMGPSEHLSTAVLPLAVALFMLIMAFLSLKRGKDTGEVPVDQPSPSRWISLLAAFLAGVAGLTLFFISLYSPRVLGRQGPWPSAGVIAFLVGALVAAIVFYSTSRKNGQRHPNLMRWIILYVVGLSAMNWPWVLTLILLYGVPGDPPTSFPFYASLAALAYVPLSFLVLGMVTDAVKLPGKPPAL